MVRLVSVVNMLSISWHIVSTMHVFLSENIEITVDGRQNDYVGIVGSSLGSSQKWKLLCLLSRQFKIDCSLMTLGQLHLKRADCHIAGSS